MEKQKPATTTEPEAPKKPENAKPEPQTEEPHSPTRYGDWERAGRCIDF